MIATRCFSRAPIQHLGPFWAGRAGEDFVLLDSSIQNLGLEEQALLLGAYVVQLSQMELRFGLSSFTVWAARQVDTLIQANKSFSSRKF